MRRTTAALLASALALGACERREAAAPPPPTAATRPAPAALPPVEPIPPGRPGGLPDDRTPVSEAPFTAKSPQGAANVLQTYFALLETGRYAEAWRLWSDGGRSSDMTAAAFAASFAAYDSYHAQVGAPGQMQGAAGSSFVEVPVQVYGRLRDGREFHRSGKAVLRRANDVPGATEEQLSWRIYRLELQDLGG
jgi:hypothetical protein